MSLEREQTKTPDPKLIWRKINLLEQEGVESGLTEDEKKAIEIRNLCFDIALSASGLLDSLGTDTDSNTRDDLVQDCVDDQLALLEMGIDGSLHLKQDPGSLDSAFKIAQYAASFFIDADFVNVPTKGEVLAQLRQNMTVVGALPLYGLDPRPLFIVFQDIPPAVKASYQSWCSMRMRVNRVASLLALE